jgi:hypothetical protein
MLEKIRKFENVHIFLWLLKDIFWVTISKTGGMIMIFPTLFLAIWITWKNRNRLSELAHNLAICAWICANSVWMTGEFFFDDTLRPISVVFFAIGIGVIGTFYIYLIFKKFQSS